MFRLDQVAMNGTTYISPEPMLERKEQNITRKEKELWASQNGKLKIGLADKLSNYQERLDVLGDYNFIIFLII